MLSTVNPIMKLQSLSPTVLVVDDEQCICEYYQAILDYMGCRVTSATDGTTALRLYEQKSKDIDIVITDYLMPGLNGVELLEAIRRIDSDLKAIMITGFRQIVNGIDPNCGRVPILCKPVTMDRLVTAMVAVLTGLDFTEVQPGHAISKNNQPNAGQWA